jgi:tellurite resistance protein TerC
LHLSLLEWVVTLGLTIAVLLFDVLVIARRPHEPTMIECALALAVYVLLAVAFGAWVWIGHGQRFGMQFFAGWLTEYSLSVDNLFIFVIVVGSFKVPKRYQQEVLFLGIVLALVFRGVVITLGGVAVQRVSWTFYLFAVFLIVTAARLALGGGHDDEARPDNVVVRLARTYLNTTDRWDGLRLYVKDGGKRAMTPMFLVVLALASTDLVFALDSIPAVYGLTGEPYLVLTVNVFALMGLRQLYFLLGGALRRLTYLSRGLAVILMFIGVKLLLQALRQNDLPFLNGGKPVDVPKISTAVSLAVIAVTLMVATAASLYKTRVLDDGGRNQPPAGHRLAEVADQIPLHRRSHRADQGVDVHRADRLGAHPVPHDAQADQLRGAQRGPEQDLVGPQGPQHRVEDRPDELLLDQFDGLGQTGGGDGAGGEGTAVGHIPGGDGEV